MLIKQNQIPEYGGFNLFVRNKFHGFIRKIKQQLPGLIWSDGYAVAPEMDFQFSGKPENRLKDIRYPQMMFFFYMGDQRSQKNLTMGADLLTEARHDKVIRLCPDLFFKIKGQLSWAWFNALYIIWF
ncbi:MAG: hypothetical protein A2277_12255 [Desulfobacterales bacterium RIFOXYA12_FULL_46_15]|nr:MAG: hypothetical protein A2097_13615 [Desulfobacula sp. GWF2_41_7]OGR25467.1 MAG: hypothetical protein A2277_12255 [Desulfobacterales bacterium RIFOXYA12_FULL_46_15]